MKNISILFKLIVSFVFIFTISTTSSAQIDTTVYGVPTTISLLSICGTSSGPNIVPNPQGTPNCAESIQLNLDESCEDSVSVAIFLTNIDADPAPGETYTLPAHYPSFYLEHEVRPGDYEISGPFRDIEYLGYFEFENTGLAFHLFGVPVSIAIDNTHRDWGHCGPKNSDILQITPKVSLLEANKAGEGYLPYPIYDYVDTGDIFDCDYYEDLTCCPASFPDCGDEDSVLGIDIYVCQHCNDCDNTIKPADDKPGTATGGDDNTQFRQQSPIVDFQAKPNPFSNQIELSVANLEGETAIVNIFDFQGRLVLNQQWTGSTNQLNVEKLAAGVYYLKVSTASQEFTQKLIKIE